MGRCTLRAFFEVIWFGFGVLLNKRVFSALFSADEQDGLLRSRFSASQTLSARRALAVSAVLALTYSGVPE